MLFILEYFARVVFSSFWPLLLAILAVIIIGLKKFCFNNLLTAILLSFYFLLNYQIGVDLNIPIIISILVLTIVGLSSLYSSNVIILLALMFHLFYNWRNFNDVALYGTSFITQTALLLSSAIVVNKSRTFDKIWLILLLFLGVLLESRSMQLSGILMLLLYAWKESSKWIAITILLSTAVVMMLAYEQFITLRLLKSFDLRYLVTNDLARMYMNVSCWECLSQNPFIGCLWKGGLSGQIFESFGHRMAGHGLIGAVGNFGLIGIGYYILFYRKLLLQYEFLRLIPLLVFGIFHDIFISPIFAILLIYHDNSIISRH